MEPSDLYDEPESEHIERLHLSTKDAYNKFKGKYLTGYVDFSDRISRHLRSGYDARSGIYECGDGEEKEQPVEKCRRLQLEMDELMHELNDLSTNTAITKEERQSYETIGDVVRNAKKVLVNLRLEQVLGTEATSATADADMKKLVAQIDEYKKSGAISSLAAPKSASELVATTRIAELENKLHDIESVIGIEPEQLKRLSVALHSNNLLDAVQKVSTIAALLQPSQLDLIETRIGNLANKMDAIAAAAASSNPNRDASVDRKTLELYEIAKRAEPIAQALPNMLARMQALENLHKYGKNMKILCIIS